MDPEVSNAVAPELAGGEDRVVALPATDSTTDSDVAPGAESVEQRQQKRQDGKEQEQPLRTEEQNALEVSDGVRLKKQDSTHVPNDVETMSPQLVVADKNHLLLADLPDTSLDPLVAITGVQTDNNELNPLAQSIDPLQQDHSLMNIKSESLLPDSVLSLAPLSLDTGLAALNGIGNGAFDEPSLMEPFQEVPAATQPATGFAKLEFPDGHFYMTTYAVELGRDMRASRIAQKYQSQVAKKEQRQPGKKHRRSASAPGTPNRPTKKEDGLNTARSFVSELGGIVGDDDGHVKLRKRKKKRKDPKSRSSDTSSSRSHSISRKNSITQPQPKFDYNFAALATVDPTATAPLDPMVHMPDPHFTPLIPIHPPVDDDEPFQTGRGISRKHVRIAYNFDKGHFEMTCLGKNGAFHDDQHFPYGATTPLHDGSKLQLGGVSLRFVLPTVALDDMNRDEDEFGSVSGRMSFSFEDGQGESIVADDDDDDDIEGFASSSEHAYAHDYDGYDYDDEELMAAAMDDDDDDGDEAIEDSSEEEVETPKRRGPGRPRVHEKVSASKANDRKASKTTVEATRNVPKLQIKISAKAKAKEKERARLKAQAEARERERERQRQEAKRVKLKAKEAAAKAEAKRLKAQAEAEEAQAKKEAEETPVKEASKEPSKTPVVEASSSKEPSAPRIARDAPMQNGEDITIPGLPAGVIIPARKKGPGRPPKDGVMSKRERALLIKQAKEREKAIKLGLDPSTIPPPEIRPPKPKPRRNSQGEEIEGDGGEGDDEKRAKIARPPRSPSPEMKIEDYSEEQLQRPSANYVYLIYEAITNAKSGVMNLQQIYSAIERKYPWYKFKAGSNGWQSSVRHNLGQHEAFKKVEKEGKGWLWGIKEGVPIERERKKKSPPPQLPPSQYPYPYQYPQYGSYPPGPPGQYAAPRPPGATAPPSVPPNGLPNMQQQPRPPIPHGVPGPPGLAGSPGQMPPSNGNGPHPMQHSKPLNGPRPGQPPHHASAPRPPQNSAGYPMQNHTSHPNRPTQYQPHPPTIRRYRAPAPDVVDTFKKVFVSTYASKEGNDTAKAEAIVHNAIKRVLEPEKMVNVPKDSQEEGVIRAFEGILVRIDVDASPRHPVMAHSQHASHAPRPSPVAPPPSHTGTPAPAPHGQIKAPTATPVPATVPPPPPVTMVAAKPASIVPTAAPRVATPNQAGSPVQSGPSTQRPQGPAEANLLGMLMGGPSRGVSGTPPIPRSTSPSGPPPASLSRPGSVGGAGPAPPPQSTTPPAPTMNARPPTAPSRSSPIPDPAGKGVDLKIFVPKDAALERLNGQRTMTPTRPAVEPLTPPAMLASPKVTGVPMATSSLKRPGSPSIAGPTDVPVKKAKVDDM